MTKHKSPLAGKVPPPKPSAAVEKAAEEIVAERATAFDPALAAPYVHVSHNDGTTVTDAEKAPTLHTVQGTPVDAQAFAEALKEQIIAARDKASADSVNRVFVPKADQPITILFKFTIVNEGEIEQTGSFFNMTEANEWLDKVKHEGVTLNSKAKAQAEWYSPYYIRKIVAKPIVPPKAEPSAS